MSKQIMKLTRKIGGAALLAALSIQAQAIPLSDLFAGQAIQSGDKLFDSWELIGIFDPLQGAPIDLSSIDVTAIGDGTAGNEYGLNFDVNLSLGGSTDTGFDWLDLYFGYTATATAPGYDIVGVTMSADANAGGADSFATVVKDVLQPGADSLLATPMEVYSDTILGTSLSDSAGFGGLSSVVVRDNIALYYDTLLGSSQATLTSFQQRFLQRGDVPVPGTMALLALGLLSLSRFRARPA